MEKYSILNLPIKTPADIDIYTAACDIVGSACNVSIAIAYTNNIMY